MVAAAEYSAIGHNERHTRRNPCEVCGGGDDDKRGRSERCAGFTRDQWCFCTREECAGGLPLRNTSPASYKHMLGGVCRCGETHSEAIERPPIDIHDRKPHIPNTNRSHTYRTPDRIHTYHTADGAPYLRVLRYGTGKEKTFCQQRPDGNGDWYDGLEGLAPILYNLPALLAADPWAPVFICEGEKACDALIERGQLATTNLGGAGKWRNTPDRLEALRGRHVVVLADNDDAGRAHADQVAADLAGVAASVRIVLLPGLGDKQDVYDWLQDGHDVGELRRLAAETTPQSACQSPAQTATGTTQDEHGAQSQKTRHDCERVDRELASLRQAFQAYVDNQRKEDEIIASSKWSAPVKLAAISLRRWYHDDPLEPLQEVKGTAGVKRVSRDVIAQRLGVKANAAGNAINQLKDDGVFTIVPDTKYVERPDGKGGVIEQPLSIHYLRPGPLYDAPNDVPEPVRAFTWGGKRERRCKHCGSADLETWYLCNGCHRTLTPAETELIPTQEPSGMTQDEHRPTEGDGESTAQGNTQDDTSPPYPRVNDLASLGEDAADGNAYAPNEPTPADAAPDAEYVGADAIPVCQDATQRKVIMALWTYQRSHGGAAPNEKEWREASGYSSSPHDVLAFMHIPTALERAGHVSQDACARFHLIGAPVATSAKGVSA